MIKASKLLTDYIEGQESKEDFARRVGISIATLYRIVRKDYDPNSETIARLLKETGFDFEKAFEVE